MTDYVNTLDITKSAKNTINLMMDGYRVGLEQAEKIGDFVIPDKQAMIKTFEREMCKMPKSLKQKIEDKTVFNNGEISPPIDETSPSSCGVVASKTKQEVFETLLKIASDYKWSGLRYEGVEVKNSWEKEWRKRYNGQG